MPDTARPESNPQLAELLSSPTGRVISRQLPAFIELMKDNPAIGNEAVLRELEDKADGTGLIECLHWMSKECAAISTAADLPSPREKASRYAGALNKVIKQLERIRGKAAAYVAGDVRDQLITLDEDGDDDQLAYKMELAARPYMSR